MVSRSRFSTTLRYLFFVLSLYAAQGLCIRMDTNWIERPSEPSPEEAIFRRGRLEHSVELSSSCDITDHISRHGILQHVMEEQCHDNKICYRARMNDAERESVKNDPCVEWMQQGCIGIKWPDHVARSIAGVYAQHGKYEKFMRDEGASDEDYKETFGVYDQYEGIWVVTEKQSSIDQ